MRLGITIPGGEPFQNSHLAELLRRAEALGYAEAWTGEAYGTDGFGPLAAAALVTQRMRLGSGIIPAATRPPALIAMSAATVHALSDGRFVLGLGISSPQIVENWMGVPFAKPVTRLRETVAVVRAALAGEKVTFEGRTVKVGGFRLDMTLEHPPPIFLAAQGASMLRLVGEIGDGLVTNFITPEVAPKMIEQVREGARAAGRAAPVEVVARILALIDEEPKRVEERMARHLTPYLITPGYNQYFAQAGFESEATQALAAWKAGERTKAVAAVTSRMLRSIYLYGSAEYCRERLVAYKQAGVTSAILSFMSLAPSMEEKRARILTALERIAPR